MPRLEQLSELQRKMLLAHPCVLGDTDPWTPPAKLPRDARVGLVTTAGLNVRGDEPFTRGDEGFRVIPVETPARDVILSHASIGFDRSGIHRDLNLVLPVDRLREMTQAGEIGSLGPNSYSFMGALRSYDTLLHESAPAVAQRLKDDGVEVVLLTPV